MTIELGSWGGVIPVGGKGAGNPPVPPGGPVYRAFPFAFDSPGLDTGLALYTPTVGDLLIDAWLAVGTAWDGTTPIGDIGTAADLASSGWFSNTWSTQDMTLADGSNGPGLTLAAGKNPSLVEQVAVNDVGKINVGAFGRELYAYLGDPNTHVTPLARGDVCLDCTNGVFYVASTAGDSSSWVAQPFGTGSVQWHVGGATPTQSQRGVPATFTAADPICVVVSQDGTTSGGSPGSTHGAAVLYLVTATPA